MDVEFQSFGRAHAAAPPAPRQLLKNVQVTVKIVAIQAKSAMPSVLACTGVTIGTSIKYPGTVPGTGYCVGDK